MKRWRFAAFPISPYAEGADGKPLRVEIGIHRWRLGLEVAFVPGWGAMPWRRRFQSLRLMFIFWHVMLAREDRS